MQAAFVLTIETDGDTDLLGIADDIKFRVEDRLTVISCHPWQRPQTSGATLPTQAAVPSTTKP